MQERIRETIETTIEQTIKKELQAGKKLTPEEFATKIASIVIGQLPNFTTETRTVFDDPHDSFSTEKETRYVTEWK